MFNVRYDMPSPSRRYKLLRDGDSRHSIMQAARNFLIRNLAGWILRRSASRHKIANRFGVPPTGILEFSETSPTSISRGGGKIYGKRSGEKSSVFISGVPFIQKAFRALHIFPRRASALTIPLHRDAVRTPAREIAAKGWETFIPRGKNFIAGKKTGSKRIVPLYALRKSVKIPRDAQLLPSSYLMDLWTRKAIQKELAYA